VETLQRMVRTLATERANLTEAQAEIERLRLMVQKLQRGQIWSARRMTTSSSSVLGNPMPIYRAAGLLLLCFGLLTIAFS
jgi:hypothetical protein